MLLLESLPALLSNALNASYSHLVIASVINTFTVLEIMHTKLDTFQ